MKNILVLFILIRMIYYMYYILSEIILLMIPSYLCAQLMEYFHNINTQALEYILIAYIREGIYGNEKITDRHKQLFIGNVLISLDS